LKSTTLTITDAAVRIEPWIPDLEPDLILHRRINVEQPVISNGGRFYNVRKPMIRDERLFTVADGAGYVYPGLKERVETRLTKLGVAFDIVDCSTPVPPLAMEKINVDLRKGQPEILNVMSTERNGTIKAATGLGKTEVIVQFIRACGKLKVAVVTFKGDVRNSIYDRIRKGCPEKTICVLRAGSVFYESDVYVLADKSLHRLPVDCVDVVIIDEVHGAGASKAFEDLCALAGKRIYGFSATPKGRHDKSDLAVECLCGPVRVDLTYEFSIDAGANVPLYCYFYTADGPRDLAKKPDFIRDRLGIWCNSRRNDLIAYLCNQLPGSEQTLIVCRTAEHVLNLRKRLPDYTCVFRSPSADREEVLLKKGLLVPGWKHLPYIIVDPDESRLRFESGDLKKVICTPVWREGMDFVHLRWLIRADGTANEIAAIQIGGRLARKTEGKESAALIDFWDDFSDFQTRSAARMRRYAKEGWIVQRMN
jgi:superfamily II DNA or RNA helicase